jgi:hypothetical protein
VRDEALGCSLGLIIPERLRARHWAGYRNVMDTSESRYGRGDVLAVPGVGKDGPRISLEFTITPLRNEGGRMLGMVAVMRDVTTRFEGNCAHFGRSSPNARNRASQDNLRGPFFIIGLSARVLEFSPLRYRTLD